MGLLQQNSEDRHKLLNHYATFLTNLGNTLGNSGITYVKWDDDKENAVFHCNFPEGGKTIYTKFRYNFESKKTFDLKGKEIKTVNRDILISKCQVEAI